MCALKKNDSRAKASTAALLVDEVATLAHLLAALVLGGLDPAELLVTAVGVDGDAVGGQRVHQDGGAELDVVRQRPVAADGVLQPGSPA